MWVPGSRTAMQRAHEGTAAPGLEEGDGLESSLLQIASRSPRDGPPCLSSDSATECNSVVEINHFFHRNMQTWLSHSKYLKVYHILY